MLLAGAPADDASASPWDAANAAAVNAKARMRRSMCRTDPYVGAFGPRYLCTIAGPPSLLVPLSTHFGVERWRVNSLTPGAAVAQPPAAETRSPSGEGLRFCRSPPEGDG